MPQTVTRTVAASDLKKGHELVSGLIVDHTEVKTKWTTIFYTTGGQKQRVENTASFSVRVEEKTEEEKAAERAQVTEMILRNARKSSAAAVAEIRTKVASFLTAGGQVSHWEFEQLAAAQATEELWARVDIIEQRIADGQIDPLTYVEIVEKIRDRCREDLLGFRASSRSTSTMSNAVEDQVLEAKRQFINRWM